MIDKRPKILTRMLIVRGSAPGAPFIRESVLSSAPAAPAQPPATIAPSTGVAITCPRGTVRRGARATIGVRTTTGVQCTIVVHYM
jgi:hypothetical protein